jgi:hypothetical protein
VKLIHDILTNLALAFGFGFGFDKVFETWKKAPDRNHTDKEAPDLKHFI